ncbi:hypothetical protein VTI74DRAFT_6279 [Chaetomium olivicolor]
MMSRGIPRDEIHKFADAKYWLHYFPQLWQQHLTEFGCGIDWRRSFITTDVNGYYDSFVRWQMRRLRDLGKIRFGKRYAIYSPKDGQPCLDHDRASGEGVLVQEYIDLKCKVVRWSERAREISSSNGSIPSDADVFMIPATQRPETMYGQTNLFVSSNISYGVFKVSEAVFYIATSRAARNMAFQDIFPEWGTVPKVLEIKGTDLVGSAVRAPLSAKDPCLCHPHGHHQRDERDGPGHLCAFRQPGRLCHDSGTVQKGWVLRHRSGVGLSRYPADHRNPRVRKRDCPDPRQEAEDQLSQRRATIA